MNPYTYIMDMSFTTNHGNILSPTSNHVFYSDSQEQSSPILSKEEVPAHS